MDKKLERTASTIEFIVLGQGTFRRIRKFSLGKAPAPSFERNFSQRKKKKKFEPLRRKLSIPFQLFRAIIRRERKGRGGGVGGKFRRGEPRGFAESLLLLLLLLGVLRHRLNEVLEVSKWEVELSMTRGRADCIFHRPCNDVIISRLSLSLVDRSLRFNLRALGSSLVGKNRVN